MANTPVNISAKGKISLTVQDREEEYLFVTRDDLRELKMFGWLHESLFGAGSFLFSGASWTLVALLANQDKFSFTPWMGVCAMSMFFGVCLGGTGLMLFWLKQKRLDKYFPRAQQQSVTNP